MSDSREAYLEAAQSIRAAFDEGFTDGAEYYRSPEVEQEAWRQSLAKEAFDAFKAVTSAVVPDDALKVRIFELEAGLLKVIEALEKETCLHEETYRGGGIWEICNACGESWADDRGGKPELDCSEINEARSLLEQTSTTPLHDAVPPSAVVPEPFGTESAYQAAKKSILTGSNMIISCDLVRELVEALRNSESQQPSAVAPESAACVSPEPHYETQRGLSCKSSTQSAVAPDDSKHHAVMQAQMWAQEARTQKAIVKQIGEIVGCANDWEMVEAVKAALASAVVPEDEVSLQDAASKICQHLPENMVLSLCMENGAAWVELGVDRIGNVKLPDSADKTLINQINDALCVAIGWNGDLVKQEQES